MSRLYEFGSFSLDSGQRLLAYEGNPVSISPKAFNLLAIMVENNGQLLHKDTLMELVWPGVAVEEGNLAVTVSQLRKALGDDRGRHKYIETVSKQGYRFVAPVIQRDEALPPIHSLQLAEAADPFYPPPAASDPAEFGGIRPSVALPAVLELGSKSMPARKIIAGLGGLVLVLLLIVGWLAVRSERKAADTAAIQSVAVLPFETIGANPSDQYLGLGTADALITRLSNTGKLHVRPTGAIEQYRNTTRAPQIIGREQQVDAIIAGRIQHDGDRVRTTVQMIRVSDGEQLWAQTFDEEFTNVFKLEDEVSERVARSIRLQLTSKQEQRFIARPTDNQEAYSAFVKGRYYWNKRTNEGMRKGLEYFREAISIDPNFADAYAGVADSYAALGLYAALPPQEAFPAARAAAHKALAMNPDLADAHATLGMINFYYDRNSASAQNEFQRTFDIDPNNAMAHSWNGESLAAQGRFSEAVAEARRSVEEDPLSMIVNSNAGWIFCLAGHDEEAIQTLSKAIDIDPTFPRAHFRLGEVYETRGLYDQAVAQFALAVKLSDGDPYYSAGLGHAYATSGRTREARQILDSLLQRSVHQYVPAFAIARIYSGLHERNNALTWLERASGDHSTSMAYLKVDPFLTDLHQEPRFHALLQHMPL